ncbi:MAG TPA: hypothetical protein VHX44_19865 [Planctomycetota bacterium]|nr:hypothetical protein [Planctomycetota bacterium]
MTQTGLAIALASAVGLGANLLHAAEDPFADLNLETHGFVSFGYLKSWGNNWHGEILEGTDEFWEAAGNVIARPMDHLRLGAQLFVRDLGEYGNGKVELDWAYADWRQSDEFGVQVGRVKIPFGLFSESVDVDAARASVFMPRTIYPTRAREILLSTDGVKAYGSLGDVDWSLFAGQRDLQTDGDFANYFAFYFRLSDIRSIQADLFSGAMVHWHISIDGLSIRVSGVWLHGLELSGTSELAPLDVDLSIPNWYGAIVSALYERADYTWACEYLRYHADRTTTSTPIGGGPSSQAEDTYRPDSLYLSCTWHARSWLEGYGALEGVWDQPTNRHGSTYTQSVVTAINLLPTAHWSLKAEYRYNYGTYDVEGRLNPGGMEMDWQVLALKTTVDF